MPISLRLSRHWRAGCGESCKSGSGRVAIRSYGCTCSDWFDHQDRTQCATTGTLPRRAAGAIRRCEALGTTKPHPNRVAGAPVRESRRLPASRRSGARVDGRANSGELPINVVRTSKPKALTGLNQKVSGQVQGLQRSPVADDAPPAKRHGPTPEDQPGERSNSVALPPGTANRKGCRWGSGGGKREQAKAGL